jgi:hydrogenase maturation factor
MQSISQTLTSWLSQPFGFYHTLLNIQRGTNQTSISWFSLGFETTTGTLISSKQITLQYLYFYTQLQTTLAKLEKVSHQNI